jgi:hypothetical protein
MSNPYLQRLKAAGILLIKGKAPRQFRQDVPPISEQEVAEARSFFPLEKFFIFGHARSGTTLLTRLVRVHPQVHCNYQAHFFTRAPLLQALVADEEVRMWLSRNSNRWNKGRDLSPVVLRAVSDYIMERDARRVGKDGPGCLVGDKSPNSLLNGQAVRLMTKVYPDARLVFIVRDGRDALISHRFQAFIDRPHHLDPQGARLREQFAQDPEPFLAGQRSIFTPKALRQGAEGWVHNLADTHQAASELLGERYYHLRYEDLLQKPHQEMGELWEFLGVDADMPGVDSALEAELGRNPDADWQRRKAGDIASALDKGKKGSWQELFTPRDRRIFKQIAGETLIAWGYERDMAW